MLPAVPGLKSRLEARARVLDVGCGTGGLMLKIAQAWPTVTCLGVDNDPHGVEQASRAIAAAGMGERVAVELVGGEGIRHKNAFDLVTMFEVLHEIAAEHRQAVMRNVGETLKPGGVFFAIDETYPSSLAELRDPGFGFAVQTQFNELVWGNIVPTREEQDRLFAVAGLVDVARAPVGGLFTLLTARKPG
jgi:cyclopropane fatty-acyl-phospholipid synthase-like methyltransferase